MSTIRNLTDYNNLSSYAEIYVKFPYSLYKYKRYQLSIFCNLVHYIRYLLIKVYSFINLNLQGLVIRTVRKVDSAIHRIVILSAVYKCFKSYTTADVELLINKTKH